MSPRNSKKRHAPKQADLKKLSLMDAIEKYMPDRRRVITRLGKGRSEPDGDIIKSTNVVKYRRFPVTWGIPMDELGYSYWMQSFIAYQPVMPWDDLIFCLNTYLPEARSFIHEEFIKTCKNVPYLIMFDSDVVAPIGAVEKLLSYRLPLVGGWYPKKSEDPKERKPVVYDFSMINEKGMAMWKIRQEVGEGLEKVDGAGAGFWVMRRDVAEAIGPRPYDMLRCGEDLELCLKVKEAGFDIYIDWQIKAEHRGVFSI